MAPKYIPESELVLNQDGSIYHLRLMPEQIADTILLVGDQARVARISKYFDRVEYKVQNREFCTHTGYLGTKRLSVLSTGIGTDNIDIVLNELDALANIHLISREIASKPSQLNLVRVGTSGTFHPDIPVESLVVSEGGLGLDTLLHFYQYEPEEKEKAFLHAFNQYTGNQLPIPPYFFFGDETLLERTGKGMTVGITATCAGFYGPQGRALRAPIAIPGLLPLLREFRFKHHRLLNFEMETSGIYGMAKILGHRAISCNVILANRANGTFSKNPGHAVEALIQKVLANLSES